MRLLCHVCLIFFMPMTLFRCEWASDNNNMNNQLHQICFSFIHSLLSLSASSLSLSSTPICISLHTVIQSQYIFIYIYVLTNDALTQKVIFLLCPIHLTFATDVWFVHFRCTSTYSNIHMRIIVNEKKKENLKWDTRHSNSIKNKGGRESNCRSFIQRD
jgi:hypothetical protein